MASKKTKVLAAKKAPKPSAVTRKPKAVAPRKAQPRASTAPIPRSQTKPLPKAKSPACIVRGVVFYPDASPAAGLSVVAFDKDIGGENRLGVASTDANGVYAIRYSEADYRLSNSERRAADVFVRVYSAGNELLLQSQTVSNAPANLRLDVKLASGQFSVSGMVSNEQGKAMKGVTLRAYDLDLRSVAIYRDVKTLAEFEKQGGFEYLGQTVSDNKGNYRIAFYESQYRRAERNKADVVVFAVEQSKNGTHIIGRSRLVNTDDYSDKGLVRGLDIAIIQTETRTEYQVVMSLLNAFLQESKVSLREIAASSEQLAFTASELEIEAERVNIAAAAELLLSAKDKQVADELFYGIGRQSIRLQWPALYKKQEEELRTAIDKSVAERIIQAFTDKEITAFLAALRDNAAKQLLDDQTDASPNSLNAMLANALPLKTQRLTYLTALGSFKGSNFEEFWSKHLPEQPEFKEQPQLIVSLQLTQQLTLITGNHQALVNALQVKRKISTAQQLLELETGDWLAIIKQTGIPDFVEGNSDENKLHAYAEQLQGMLNAAFPTQRIANMLQKNSLPIEKAAVTKSITSFLAQTTHFDFTTSRVHDFDKEIEAAAKGNFKEARIELMKIQRVFQVSTSPAAMVTLLESKLHSAHTIANIPQKSFVKKYAEGLGGERDALAIHQRAMYISAKAEMTATTIMEYANSNLPAIISGGADRARTLSVVENHLPNYTELFGSPDMCECEHCRSVYSPAAYFVDLLQFLKNSEISLTTSALAILAIRRPDLLHLPLTCENTNTIIPYIDLANEVMEYYTANNSLSGFNGHNTGVATADELRANPQNFNLVAYRTLKDAKYPFTLPYHQPLDVIRTYSGHLKVSRYEAMKAMNPLAGSATGRAIAAESLHISEEEYTALTGETFSGPEVPTTTLNAYFGYGPSIPLNNLSAVPEFLRRTGIAYTDLVALLKTQYINPQLTGHIDGFDQVITLYQPESLCDLETTTLRTLGTTQNIDWSKFHRFIRLWRKLGWSIDETGLMLAALGEDSITVATIAKLEAVSLLKTATRLPLNQLAVLWGNIDTYGDKSLYRKLFLNKAVQQIDVVFMADAAGAYLQGGGLLSGHRSAILAAFQLREEDLAAILAIALIPDVLNLANLSIIYRHAVLAKALKMRVTDLCKLLALFGGLPFNAPENTLKLYQLVEATRKSAFNASSLEYILLGTLPADSSLGLSVEKTRVAFEAIRAEFSVIEQNHPTTPPAPLTPEILVAKLALRFENGVVSQMMAILQDTAVFATDILYEEAAGFIRANFSEIITNLYEAQAILLNRSVTATPADKFVYIYTHLIPVLKSRLQRNAIIQHVATLIGLSEADTEPLITADVDEFITGVAAETVDSFAALAATNHRAAKFITGFRLSNTELKHLLTFSDDFGSINFKALTVAHWQRVNDYVALRNAVPQAQALLTDVFAAARATTPPDMAELQALLLQATAWDTTNLEFLVTHFGLGTAGLMNEIVLNQLLDVMRISAKTGLSAQTIARWGAVEMESSSSTATGTAFDRLNTTAQLIKNTVKAKYGMEDWLALAGEMSNTLRENQKQALIAYLLTRPEIDAQDADGLFEYFLIDVQMGACMDTSRIVQANSSVQLFVSRCLLNLEPVITPDAIDRERWEWMKNYRVWEANRKVFLYPENWLEPEWRINRSPFFKELESYLVQNDITDRSVEQGFRNYLTSLNEVVNLEVCGMHQEKDGNKLTCLHVFARTHNAPYKYFYRNWNKHKKWSAWEKVQVDIRSVENGDKSGVHLIPVVWKKRLFLFWPEFMEKQEARENSSETFRSQAERPMSDLEPTTYWEIRLAWSEYVDGKWSPKQVSKEFIDTISREFLNNRGKPIPLSEIGPESRISWGCKVSTNELKISARFKYFEWYDLGDFNFSDIASVVTVNRGGFFRGYNWGEYFVSFLSYSKGGNMSLAGQTYLDLPFSDRHKILVMPTQSRGAPAEFSGIYSEAPLPEDPFFFSDVQRTYFVRPIKEIITLNFTARNSNWGEVYNERHLYTAGIYNITQSTQWLFLDGGLQFNTFHHPFSGQYVENLNKDGMSGLMESDTNIRSDNGRLFRRTYKPNFTAGRVQRPSDFTSLARTYYKQNVCFDPYGANSLYNWELFFHAPLYIATRLSKNGKFAEAMKWFHYIFDPTTDEAPVAGSETSRYWKVRPFKTTNGESLDEMFRRLASRGDTDNVIANAISEWRDNPFDPHLIASNRPLAYMKNVVVKYVENLVAWGDFLFRQDTMESVNEAIQMYVFANHILGPKPEVVPKRGEIEAETYASLEPKLDDFSNALVELENLFPYSSDTSSSGPSTGSPMLGVGSSLYFCIPQNQKLLDNWDTVADRLYKIRHCQNIDGVERKLALFSPPIDPALLIQATAQGLSLGSALDDLGSPPPIYRYTYLMQKTNEFCADVKALGSALLVAIEKKDAEELGRLRASHETQMLELMTSIRERQLLDARVGRQGLSKSREAALFRLRHYIDLLGNDAVTVPDAPSLDATLTADSQLPVDTIIATIATDVDVSLVDSDESGIKLIPREKEDLDKSEEAKWFQTGASAGEALAGIFHLFPTVGGHGTPLGVGVSAGWGGQNLGAATSALAKVAQIYGQLLSHEASQASKTASYIRRDQDWTLQANLAARDIIQLDKQITSADIRIQVSEKELANHKQQLENTKQVEQFLKDKFTNQELYQWMKEQLFSVYRQSYNLAYDMARKTEKAYKYEVGTETASFIQYGYWDNSKQGLVSGEKLQLALRQLEKSYLEENRRELELTKTISLARLNPLALIELRETGKCYVSVPEELFDLDFRGHYFRRIKSVRLSIPCVAGPYTSVNCSLRLLNNSVRINTSMNSEGNYEHENDEGLLIDDDRFRTNHAPVTSIATSSAQSDSGMFEFNFRDERYLPFEYAGAVSEWQVELSMEKELRQFDYSTISDVILHLSYTARENGGLFKEKATTYIKDFIMNTAELADQPLMQMFGMKHEFPTEWRKFLHPASEGAEQLLNFTLGKERFPFFVQDRDVVVMKIEVFAKCAQAGSYHMILSYVNLDEDAVTSTQITVPPNTTYGDLNKATINVNDAGLNLEELDIERGMSLKVKFSSALNYTSLGINPDEVEDLFLVVHYKVT